MFALNELGNPLVGDGVFVEESMVFFDQRLTEFGGEGGCFDAEAVGFAGEHLFEVGDVAVHGLDAVLGASTGFDDAAAFKEEQATDFFFVGQGWSEVVNGAASW